VANETVILLLAILILWVLIASYENAILCLLICCFENVKALTKTMKI
jgi:hypothetical protein